MPGAPTATRLLLASADPARRSLAAVILALLTITPSASALL
jgi:hypothetical protein